MSDVSASSGEAVPIQQLRRYSLGGTVGIGLMLAIAVGVSAVVQVDSAVIASGYVSVDEGSQEIAHPLGGVVEAIHARDGDVVRSGEVLVELRTTQEDASIASLEQQAILASMKVVRLDAEVSDLTEFSIPQNLIDKFDFEQLTIAHELEAGILNSRQSAIRSEISQVNARIEQQSLQAQVLDVQRTGLEQKVAAIDSQILALETQPHGSGFASDMAALVQERSSAVLQLETVALQKRGSAAALREQNAVLSQMNADARIGALVELEAAKQYEIQANGELEAVLDARDESKLVSPVDGIVYDSTLDTLGGVLIPGTTVMKILPAGSDLAVTAQINAVDIDKAVIGGDVRILFPAFNQNVTPQLMGTISSVAPNVTQDPATGASFYLAQIVVASTETDKLPEGFTLTPGMPAEVFLETGDRSILSYLTKPLIDKITHIFREE